MMVANLRSSVRRLVRRPRYALGVVATLGLGMAAVALVTAVAWRIWLTPMPYPDPDKVVRLYEIEPSDPTTGVPGEITEAQRHQLSAVLLEDFRAHAWRTIEAVSAMSPPTQEEWLRDGEIQTISSVYLSPDGFAVLGIVPMLGRLPTEVEREALLSERFWRTDFGADPDVVGSQMSLGWGQVLIVGVAPLPSGYPDNVDTVYMVEWDRADDARGLRFVDAIARVGPDYSVAEARAEANAYLSALAEIHPEHRGWRMDAVLLAETLLLPFRDAIVLLLAGGTTFLLLAGVNVSGLVAARRVEGRHDRSIQLALGVSERQLLVASVTESLVLALVGSLVGLLGAYWLIGPIRSMVPQDVPRLDEVAITLPLVLGGLAVGVVMGVLIGLSGYVVSRGAGPSVGRVPTWRASRVRGRRALVVAQVALTAMLAAGGVAVLHRVSTLRGLDLGFNPEGVSISSAVLGNIPQEVRWELLRTILEGLEARNIAAAVAINIPMSGEDLPGPFGIQSDANSAEIFFEWHPVSSDYFSVMGIEVLAGRVFEPADEASSAQVAIVSREFVAQYFPDGTPVESAVGRVLGPVPFGGNSGPTVIGVVESTRHSGPDIPVAPDIYIPLSQLSLPPATLLLAGDPGDIGESVFSLLDQVDPAINWSALIPYTFHLREWFTPLRLLLIVMVVLGSLGLVLASLGLYSLMAYQVATDRKSIGIRKTLGAAEGRLVLEIVTVGMAMALLGAAMGLGAWYQTLPFTRELVDGLDSSGYVVPVTVVLVVGASCALATLIPAARAARVDPVAALRAD